MAKPINLLGTALLLALAVTPLLPLRSASAAEIDRDANAALRKLLASTPQAKALAAKAKGILVFPSIDKAGFLVGGLYGNGGLRVEGKTVGYYNTTAASYGLQAGVQKYGYALFFMNETALQYLDEGDGWELGTGPNIVIVDKGVAGGLSTTTARDDVYGLIFDQKGLMAGIGQQGSKITKINP